MRAMATQVRGSWWCLIFRGHTNRALVETDTRALVLSRTFVSVAHTQMVSSCQPQFLGDLRWVARFGLMSQIGASQIEAPIGSLFQKYVSSSFMVKMRIDLGSLGLFWFILGWG